MTPILLPSLPSPIILSLSLSLCSLHLLALREAYDEFEILANSWRFSQQYTSELFFVMVDIDEDGMDAFQQV